MKIEKAKIKDLISPTYNPRDITPDEMEKLKTSIQEFGYVDPIIVNEHNNHIVGGNQRYEALKSLEYTEVDVVYINEPDPNSEKALNIALNKISGEWDFGKLSEILDDMEMEGFDITLTGFDGLDDIDIDLDGDYEPDYDEEYIETEEDDFEVDDDIDVTVETGDIYQLGKHRLMCGDSTNENNVAELMDGNLAELVFTDPPYNMEAQGGSDQWVGQSAKKVGESIKELCDFEPDEFLQRVNEIFDKNMNAYIFCNKDLVPEYLNWAIDNKYSFNILFWKKPNAPPLGEQHRPDVEYLIFIRKNATWNNGVPGLNYSKCLEFARENSTPHPTMKPVELIANEIQISSNENGIIADLYGGSGSTLIACEQTNRQCYMMEIDPKYCQIIINRWEEYTGETAEKIN